MLALVQLDLQKLGSIPVDSTAAVRPVSPLGLKYLELTLGRSLQRLNDGATLPVSQTHLPVDIDHVFSMFDSPTRRAAAANELAYGDALAGRGGDLNQFIAGAPDLAAQLAAAMANLSGPATRLPGFFHALDRFTRSLAPVSTAGARTFSEMADTFGAISVSHGTPLQQTIARQPATLTVGTRSLRTARPVLEHLAALSDELASAARALKLSLPGINGALRVVTPVTRSTPTFSNGLRGTLAALDRLTAAPTTGGALRGLTATVTSLQPTLRYVGPFITVCNYWNMWWTFFAGVDDAQATTGTETRQMFMSDSQQDDSLGGLHANQFVHGANVMPGGVPEYLHGNWFGHRAVTTGGQADCQAGQAGYTQHGAPVVPNQGVYGQDVIKTSSLVGPAGPTYATFNNNDPHRPLGPTHVPLGETFSATPGGLGRFP